MRHYKTLTWTSRLRIEAWRQVGISPQEIAKRLGVHYSTIYRELKRGQYVHLNSDWTTDVRYSPDISERKKQTFLRAKGGELKIGSDRAFAEYIERKIIKEKYAPGALLGEMKAKGIKFSTSISKTTLYRYIDNGVFLHLSNKHLPIKKNVQHRKKLNKKASRAPIGHSIEKRPAEVTERISFGHWEMDCVVGPKGAKNVLLVLTERLTRFEIIRKMKEKTAKSVVIALNNLEREYGSRLFRMLFRSITVDNGSEFSDVYGLENAFSKKVKRTHVYYCHPYSSWERGSNENQNRMIRRFYPKGFNFEKTSPKEIGRLEHWINDYPRAMFGYKTSADMFAKYFGEINL